MQHHFRHALGTHGTSTILGFRTDGRPIYAVAGGNGEGEDGWTTGTPPTANIEGTPPARRPSAPPAEFAPGGDSAERQAESRKWERHDMQYKGAADELAARKASQRSEQEKVAVAAETRDRKAAALKHGWDLAATASRPPPYEPASTSVRQPNLSTPHGSWTTKATSTWMASQPP